MKAQEVLEKTTKVIFEDCATGVDKATVVLIISTSAFGLGLWKLPNQDPSQINVQVLLFFTGVMLGGIVIAWILAARDRRLKRHILKFVWEELINKRSEICSQEDIKSKFYDSYWRDGNYGKPRLWYVFNRKLKPMIALQVLLLLREMDSP